MFTLCNQCAQYGSELSDNTGMTCNHTKEERRLKNGVWTVIEVQQALNMGYELSGVHEVWHYEERSSELFRPYIRENLKLKLQASGWPKHCTTEEAKREFLAKVKREQDVELEYDKMVYNPGQRQIAKLNLNSLWGKLAQNPFHSQTEYTTDAFRYFQLLNDDTKEVTSILQLSDKMVQVNYKTYSHCTPTYRDGKSVIGSHVTARARQVLLKGMLELGGGRVLYHDTDSIIYTSKEGEPEIELGCNLGEWEDECKDPDADWLVDFVSLGPKTYAYRTKQGKCVVKCKGVSLDNRTEKKIHMESMKRMLVNKKDKMTVSCPRKILRDTGYKQLKNGAHGQGRAFGIHQESNAG